MGSDGDRLASSHGAASVTRRWDGTATERRRSVGKGTGSRPGSAGFIPHPVEMGRGNSVGGTGDDDVNR